MPSMVPDGAAAAAASPGPTKHHITVALTLYCNEKYASGDLHMHTLPSLVSELAIFVLN